MLSSLKISYTDLLQCSLEIDDSNKQHLINKMILNPETLQGLQESNQSITFSKYDYFKLPQEFKASRNFKVTIENGVFLYLEKKEEKRISEWYMNFADGALFGYYGNCVFAQDEHQVAEHTLCAHLREYLVALDFVEHLSPDTTRNAKLASELDLSLIPTPCLIESIPHLAKINIDPKSNCNLYGNKFRCASRKKLIENVEILKAPFQLHNILAIMAPVCECNEEKYYTENEITNALITAYSGFCAVRRQVSSDQQVKIHTGLFGCGAFGGDPVLMIAVQCIAARLSGIDHLVLHSFEDRNVASITKGVKLANDKIWPLGTISFLTEIVACLLKEKFEWHSGNGT